MNKKIKVAVVGYGNIGKHAVEAILLERDMELTGVIDPAVTESPAGLEEVRFVKTLDELRGVQVALLCVPTRMVLKMGLEYLKNGICIVDIFDIHGEALFELYKEFDRCAKENGVAALLAVGWDPGINSAMRALMKVMIPKGITYTNYGPGMSMGHSVVAKLKPGVRDAVSLTFPKGSGLHRRMVYIILEPGCDKSAIEKSILEDSYFAGDETHVIFTDSLEDVKDFGNASLIERKGRAGIHSNQRATFHTELNNPAVTSQVLVAAARAVSKQRPGAYTVTQIPIIDFLDITVEETILSLV